MQIDRNKASGFTLIEMMIVVVVIAVLAAIAIPAYQKYVMESRRTAAKTALFDLASREEKYYSTNNQYTNTLSELGYNTTAATITVPNGNAATDYYTISVALTGATTANTNFKATATTLNTQTSDTYCGNYSLTDLGAQANTGSQTTGCW
ncbi:prepilin-type N-terminal cleavage/methylation domain-containing protein [Dyella monticola]|uniref:Prepilin-type N-terminal cleavage/methylation domain-containing protein n=1 Tax=Dyella monticola TaxID=1927958 RepID=A0A370X8K3_9GAMM|nr:type IV pilin protein [Dyella monticola]RDS84744.1 prepilin-type N-terminal cleavage/methylation domain-containing protein [Dyella monticola]